MSETTPQRFPQVTTKAKHVFLHLVFPSQGITAGSVAATRAAVHQR